MKSDQTCFFCQDQKPVDEDGIIGYHDYPLPCRMLCWGSKRPSVECIADTADLFRTVVADYLEGGATLRVFVPELAERMATAFEQDRDWPRRVVRNLDRPHPLLREAIVKWIGQQLREERAGEAG